MKRVSIVTLSFMAISSAAYAGGFEKAIMTSARYGGIAGAASSSVTGTEALMFNPAGLAHRRPGLGVTLNFDPTISQFKGPILAANDEIRSTVAFSPVFSAFADYAVSEKLGVGIGVYTPGGTNATFESIVPPGVTGSQDVTAKLSVIEASIGAGYEVVEGLKIGAAWRVVMVNAELATLVNLGDVNAALAGNFGALDLTDLSDTQFGGYRIGAQYQPVDAKWGVGVDYRSSVDFTAEGTASGQVLTAAAALDATSGNASISAEFPMQLNIGTHYDITDAFTWYTQYTFTRYAVNRELDLAGGITLPAALPAPFGGAAFAIDDLDFQLGWRNQHNLRLAAELGAKDAWRWRAGYVLTTQVVPERFARATFSSPGLGHTFVVGGGFGTLAERAFTYDVALEYSVASGEVAAADVAPAGSVTTAPGEYSSQAAVLHAGVTYHF